MPATNFAHLVIVTNKEAGPLPFSFADFLNKSECLVAWGYREVWPITKWYIKEWAAQQDVCLIFDTLRCRWLSEALGVKTSDNHQTFLVDINECLYYVMFHDDYILISDKATMG